MKEVRRFKVFLLKVVRRPLLQISGRKVSGLGALHTHGMAIMASRATANGGVWFSCGSLGSSDPSIPIFAPQIASGIAMHGVRWHRCWAARGAVGWC